jgi:hypothetical protein
MGFFDRAFYDGPSGEEHLSDDRQEAIDDSRLPDPLFVQRPRRPRAVAQAEPRRVGVQAAAGTPAHPELVKDPAEEHPDPALDVDRLP